MVNQDVSDHSLRAEGDLDGDEHDAEGDFRGAYGYGRPSHRPDPSATYSFQPGLVRPLPVKARCRWR